MRQYDEWLLAARYWLLRITGVRQREFLCYVIKPKSREIVQVIELRHFFGNFIFWIKSEKHFPSIHQAALTLTRITFFCSSEMLASSIPFVSVKNK
jgi:hypothetical protein